MSVDVLMPKLGESITEGTILEWKKSVGDDIKKDERQKSEIAAAVTSDAIQKAFVEVMKRRLK